MLTFIRVRERQSENYYVWRNNDNDVTTRKYAVGTPYQARVTEEANQ
jgi:hypothetical protein|tara:strand:- start:539 stop:679 length:141 start_codon:yes stop_codon:yes gene_type:complete